MTKKKFPAPRRRTMKDLELDLASRIARLEEEANRRLAAKEPTNQESVGETIDTMARARHQDGAKRPRRHATPGGPNFPDDIYPPGCGPLQLVWEIRPSNNPTLPSTVTIGWQGDSFASFPSRTGAVSWLLGIAQRIINDKIPTTEG
jgi:hypothetical protein